MFDLRELERFMAIVEHRNFGRAAAVLGMTQPALSRAIAALEGALGMRLFSRERRQIELTAAGELLAREARAVLAQAALAERVMREASRGTTGHLRLGTRSSSRYTLIPDAIHLLRELEPQVSVTVSDPLLALQVDHLRKGLFDLTVVHGPVRMDGGLRCRRLRTDPLVVALPERHPLAKNSVVDARQLADEPLVELAWYEAYGYKELARGVCARAGFVPRVVQEVDTVDTLAICVAAGIGAALMHDARKELPIPGVVYRPLHPAPPPVELSAVWRAGDVNTVIEPFVECLIAAARASAAPSGPPFAHTPG